LEDAACIRETVRRALGDGHDLIVLGGGDGSVSTVAGILAGSDTVLGVLPLGNANDFARTMGIPFELAVACGTVAHGVVADVDLGLAGMRYLGAKVGSSVPESLTRFDTTGNAIRCNAQQAGDE
jgi:diacylglycerol kinase (ATP)